jgi:hypothetical protein
MSDSKLKTERIGFSTGALEKGNYKSAIKWICEQHIRSIELSALRYDELEPLVEYLDSFPIQQFQYVSFHAPSSFPKEVEEHVVRLLEKVAKRKWNIIVHPDVIRKPALWRRLKSRLLIENMDRRKPIGRTAGELEQVFAQLPDARLCLDVAHARQLDTTLGILWQIITRFSDRIEQIHISELDSQCRHHIMSWGAVNDYRRLAPKLKSTLPVIIESMLDECPEYRMDEFKLATCALEFHTNGHNQNSRKNRRSTKTRSSYFP